MYLRLFWFSISFVFLTVHFLAQEEGPRSLSLKKMYLFFEGKKDNRQDQNTVKTMARYQHVLLAASDAIANKTTAPDHVWYRLEVAKAISYLPRDVFAKIRCNLLFWNQLLTMRMDTNYTWYSFEKPFRNMSCVFYWNGILSYISAKFAKSVIQYQMTTRGIHFGEGKSYGYLNYVSKKASLHYKGNNIDFSDLVPWPLLKIYDQISIIPEKNMIHFTFWDNGGRLQNQISYELLRTRDYDLSHQACYKSYYPRQMPCIKYKI